MGSGRLPTNPWRSPLEQAPPAQPSRERRAVTGEYRIVHGRSSGGALEPSPRKAPVSGTMPIPRQRVISPLTGAEARSRTSSSEDVPTVRPPPGEAWPASLPMRSELPRSPWPRLVSSTERSTVSPAGGANSAAAERSLSAVPTARPPSGRPSLPASAASWPAPEPEGAPPRRVLHLVDSRAPAAKSAPEPTKFERALVVEDDLLELAEEFLGEVEAGPCVELDLDREEDGSNVVAHGRILAGFGERPSSLWRTPSYALRAFARRRHLARELDALQRARSPLASLYEEALRSADQRSIRRGLALIALGALAGAVVVAFGLQVLLRLLHLS